MALVRTGETEYEKELQKWDVPKPYQPFPKMVYRAIHVQGAVTVLSMDGEHDRQTTRIVGSERELNEALSSGWHPTPKEAYDALEHKDRQTADDAAEVNYEVSKMSRKARTDFAQQAAATDKHLVK